MAETLTIVPCCIIILLYIFRLTELTVGKCFIAAVSKVPSEHKQSYCNTIPALATLGETFIQLYPLFFVDLSNSDNRYITDILTNEGLALPDDTSFITSKKEVSWVILRVTHVSGSVQLWGEFSVDKKDKEHWEMFERFHKDVRLNTIIVDQCVHYNYGEGVMIG